MSKVIDAQAEQTAAEIATEASRLQRLALKHEFQFLGYLLEMVILEAWREASGESTPREDAKREQALVRSG